MNSYFTCCVNNDPVFLIIPAQTKWVRFKLMYGWVQYLMQVHMIWVVEVLNL